MAKVVLTRDAEFERYRTPAPKKAMPDKSKVDEPSTQKKTSLQSGEHTTKKPTFNASKR